MATVRKIKLGSQGLQVSAQGLGCLGMSAFYGPPKPESQMIALIHHAINSGITFLDTADIYGPHTNEILLGKALKGGMRERVELATKFAVSIEDGKREVRGDPAYVRAACEASLKRLDVDCIDLYYQLRVDTRVPIEVTGRDLSSSSSRNMSDASRSKKSELRPVRLSLKDVQKRWLRASAGSSSKIEDIDEVAGRKDRVLSLGAALEELRGSDNPEEALTPDLQHMIEGLLSSTAMVNV
ncbi:hypothetical protein JRO89_XS04G0056900 [Xanthoceras sorbifolium]|uniref:NADP-dependent oxidoreductase domain-containing protein n=1 Tax=Xanthoceras sorbifolium TaxID=99658 RepID=A0ABQ8I4B2_9ROSI|nr:hypothetical protein JRO89_XS04G0056900 [Xanthoceras sorbifolium]